MKTHSSSLGSQLLYAAACVAILLPLAEVSASNHVEPEYEGMVEKLPSSGKKKTFFFKKKKKHDRYMELIATAECCKLQWREAKGTKNILGEKDLTNVLATAPKEDPAPIPIKQSWVRLCQKGTRVHGRVKEGDQLDFFGPCKTSINKYTGERVVNGYYRQGYCTPIPINGTVRCHRNEWDCRNAGCGQWHDAGRWGWCRAWVHAIEKAQARHRALKAASLGGKAPAHRQRADSIHGRYPDEQKLDESSGHAQRRRKSSLPEQIWKMKTPNGRSYYYNPKTEKVVPKPSDRTYATDSSSSGRSKSASMSSVSETPEFLADYKFWSKSASILADYEAKYGKSPIHPVQLCDYARKKGMDISIDQAKVLMRTNPKGKRKPVAKL